MLELLRALGDRFEQVVLITHIESVRDGVDQVIAVRYDPSLAQSIVEQSAGGGNAMSDSPQLVVDFETAGAA